MELEVGQYALFAQGLTRRYGHRTAVGGLDLAVKRGEVFGLVGPDGAGKTTVIQLLCGILRPSAGRVFVAGREITRDPELAREVTGYMSQDFTLYEDLTVEENLDFFANLRHLPPPVKAQREAMMYRFSRLEPFQDRLAGRLSGGMKKKLALSCALLHHPEVLFLDEPTTGVDPLSRMELWKILYQFIREGVTIFLSTPYLDEAERCSRVAFLQQGRILACDGPPALKERLPETIFELQAAPQEEGVRILRERGFKGVQVFGNTLHVAGESGPDRIVRVLEERGVKVERIARVSPTLDDVYISTIRMLCGLLLPTAGDARIAGYSVSREKYRVRGRIGYMSQKFSLYPDLTVRQNLELYASIYAIRGKEKARRLDWILEIAGLKGREKERTRALSGGFKQRLALGCAVIHQPPVLFLDEPTAGVDPLSRMRFWEIIYRLSEEGMTVLVTTHFMDEAEHCHRLGLMYGGRLIALGSPEGLKEGLEGELFHLTTSSPMEAYRRLEAMPLLSRVALFGAALHVTVERETGEETLRRALRESGIDLLEMKRIAPSLEDVFVGYLGQEVEKP